MASTYGSCEACGEYAELTNGTPKSDRRTVVKVTQVFGYCQSCLMTGVATPVIGNRMTVGNTIVTTARHATSQDIEERVMCDMIGNMFGVPTVPIQYGGFVPSGTSFSYGSAPSTIRFGNGYGSDMATAIFLSSLSHDANANKRQQEEAESNKRQQEADANKRRQEADTIKRRQQEAEAKEKVMQEIRDAEAKLELRKLLDHLDNLRSQLNRY